jgi:hypothetical protein
MERAELYDYDVEDVMLFLKQLEKRRQKITVRGRLTEEEDIELMEIDCETEFWQELLDEMLFEPDAVDEDPAEAAE